MKREWNVFLASLLFFTRLPVKLSIPFTPDLHNQSTKYLPLVGVIVGCVSGLIYLGASYIFPSTISILLSIAGGILLTGAFHEDGFSDSCDGFGGGWTKEKVLLIMKDSRVGAYGLIGTILLFMLKFESLSIIPSEIILQSFIISHALSRLLATTFVFTHDYARTDDSSKSKDISNKLSVKSYLIACIAGVVPLVLLMDWFVVFLIPLQACIWFLYGLYINKKIGGYTGDALGAVQQLGEVACYLFIIAMELGKHDMGLW